MSGASCRPPASPYSEALDTGESTPGLSARRLFAGRYVMTARAARSRSSATITGSARSSSGIVMTRDSAKSPFAGAPAARRGSSAGPSNTTRIVPRPSAVRAHLHGPWRLRPGRSRRGALAVSVSASGRLDRHSEYGTFFSPRVAALLRAGRLEQPAVRGRRLLRPVGADGGNRSGGTVAAVDSAAACARKRDGARRSMSAATDGPASYTVTLFASRVRHPIHVDRTAGLVLSNAPRRRRTPASNSSARFGARPSR